MVNVITFVGIINTLTPPDFPKKDSRLTISHLLADRFSAKKNLPLRAGFHHCESRAFTCHAIRQTLQQILADYDD